MGIPLRLRGGIVAFARPIDARLQADFIVKLALECHGHRLRESAIASYRYRDIEPRGDDSGMR